MIVTYRPLSYKHHGNTFYIMEELYMDIRRALGLAIKDFRLERNLSQERFALKIEMDRTYFASVESGKRNVSVENISKIADGLDISLEELFLKVEEYRSNKK